MCACNASTGAINIDNQQSSAALDCFTSLTDSSMSCLKSCLIRLRSCAMHSEGVRSMMVVVAGYETTTFVAVNDRRAAVCNRKVGRRHPYLIAELPTSSVCLE